MNTCSLCPTSYIQSYGCNSPLLDLKPRNRVSLVDANQSTARKGSGISVDKYNAEIMQICIKTKLTICSIYLRFTQPPSFGALELSPLLVLVLSYLLSALPLDTIHLHNHVLTLKSEIGQHSCPIAACLDTLYNHGTGQKSGCISICFGILYSCLVHAIRG